MCAVSTSENLAADERSGEAEPHYHHGNLREALLLNGLALMEATGDTAFSLRELSRQVGVSANAAYRHFANKDDLLTAIAVYGFQQLVSAQAQAVQDNTNPRDGFLAAGVSYVGFARRHPALFRLMFGRFAVTHRNEELSAVAQLAYEGMRYSTALALNKPLDDPQLAALATQAWSLVHGLSHLIIDGQFDATTDDIDGLVSQVLVGSFDNAGRQ